MTAPGFFLGQGAAIAVALTALGLLPGMADAASGPTKQVIESHVGWEVDKTTKGSLCTVASKDECQPGKFSSEPAGLIFAKGIASGPSSTGNFYVADQGNNRVQELTQTGKFVLMFGKKVNATTGGDICTEAEIEAGGKCQAGEPTSEAGALLNPISVAVDPGNGDVYVVEPGGNSENKRVDRYSASGQFIWMVGKEVNATTKENLCTANEVKAGDECQAATPTSPGTAEHGAFFSPEAIAVSPSHVVYVGSVGRVQELNAEGEWIGEINEPLEQRSSEGRVTSLTIDQAGDVFLVYAFESQSRTILELDPAGDEIKEFQSPEDAFIVGIAADGAGRLAVIQFESGRPRGILYEVEESGLRPITEFEANGAGALAFNGTDDLYAVSTTEATIYKQVPVGEVLTAPVTCAAGSDEGDDATFACDLNGAVDPWGVKETVAWFQWGRTSELGEETRPNLAIPVSGSEGEEEALVPITEMITGLRPNEKFYYRVAGEDEHVRAPELLASAVESFATPSAAPRVVGQPAAWFVNPTSVDLSGEINPENAPTTYEFQYVPANACQQVEGCGTADQTKTLTSNAYGAVGVMLEASDLLPSTEYLYRLYGVNKKGQVAVDASGQPQLPEGRFTTAAIPEPSAETGASYAVGLTTATISGLANADGQEATFSFEVGIDKGPSTEYTTVYSASVDGSGDVPESFTLVGLQAGTSYSYRIAVKSGYIENEAHTTYGDPRMFTTSSVVAPVGQVVPVPILGTPAIAMPKTPTTAKMSKKARKDGKRRAKCGHPRRKRTVAKRCARRRMPRK
jgi:hypothetical protein